MQDTVRLPLSDAPAAIVLGFASITIRGEGWLDADDEETVLALLGLPSEVLLHDV